MDNQTWKRLHVIYLILSICVCLPYWVLVSLPRSWRPRPTWTIYKSVLIKFIRHIIYLLKPSTYITDIPNHMAIEPCEDAIGVWIEPANHLLTGDLKTWAEIANTTSIRVPGYWMHKPEIKPLSKPLPHENVVYYLHGGGYVRMSGHPGDVTGTSHSITASLPRSLLQLSKSVTRVLSLEYRLAVNRRNPKVTHPFPSQLLDALAGYNYLVNEVGFQPKNIIIAGDSAGGNLAHALTQYLVEYQDSKHAVPLPDPPGALLLISPWVDLSDSCHRDSGPNRDNAFSDYLKPPGIGPGYHYARSAFLGPHGLSLAANSHYISPASLFPTVKPNFKNFPRTFINAGGAEVLIEMIRIYRDRIVAELGEGDGVKESDGGKVRYLEMPDGVHDYVFLNRFEPERTLTLQEITRWLDAPSQ